MSEVFSNPGAPYRSSKLPRGSIGANAVLWRDGPISTAGLCVVHADGVQPWIILGGIHSSTPLENLALPETYRKKTTSVCLIQIGNPYQTEYAISFEWLGIAGRDAELGPLHLPRMATMHTSGPPHMRPTWPTGLTFDNAAFQFGREPERVAFDVDSWGDISISY